jgi:glucosamine kinase
MKQYFMGIDGGGSNLRVVITDENLHVVGSSVHHETANPVTIGHTVASMRVQKTIEEALKNAELSAVDLTALGVGIAGAYAEYAETWLRETLAPVITPYTYLALSGDVEIALVGANGERRGIMVLAGTGSSMYGVNDAGQALLMVGWGYLLGDEGSGFWLGKYAIRHALTYLEDAQYSAPRGSQALTQLVLNFFEARTRGDLIRTIYSQPSAPVKQIAKMAESILDLAKHDADTQAIAHRAAEDLFYEVERMKRLLKLENPPIAYAGGILSHENVMSKHLTNLLQLRAFPKAKHEPVIGAALLAKLNYEKSQS